MSKKIKKIKNSLEKVKGKLKKKKSCDDYSFWTLYRIINFNRYSMKGYCKKTDQKIQLEYLGHKKYKKYPLVRIFSCILWMSPAVLIVLVAHLLAQDYGPWIYFLAIIDIVVYHFWAMYYIIRGGLIKVVS